MARSINKVTLVGIVGNIDFRATGNGSTVGTISLATDESYMDKNTGQKVEQTEWHRVTVFGKLAEICQQYVTKGSKLYVEGKLKTREWEKDGVKRYSTEIVMNEMLMLGSPNGSQGGGQPQPAHQQQQYQQQQYQQQQQFQQPQQQYQQQQRQYQQQPQFQPPMGGAGGFDDDIPF